MRGQARTREGQRMKTVLLGCFRCMNGRGRILLLGHARTSLEGARVCCGVRRICLRALLPIAPTAGLESYAQIEPWAIKNYKKLKYTQGYDYEIKYLNTEVKINMGKIYI